MADDIYVSSGVTSSGITVKDNAMYVLPGGTASKTTADTGGLINIDSQGKAYMTTVNSDGLLTLSSEGVADGTTVNSGGSIYVWSGGVASGVTLNPGATLEVVHGGSAVQVMENGGCVSAYEDDVTFVPNVFTEVTLDTYATVHSGTVASCTYINDSGRLDVFSSGLAYQTMINADGCMTVSSGGSAADTVDSGLFEVYDNGTAAGTTVESGGSMTVSSGGLASVTTVNPGGTLVISSGGTGLQIRENGGIVYLDDETECSFLPSVISETTLNDDATVHSETTVTKTVINARLLVYEGGIVNSITLNDSGVVSVFSGGMVDNVTVNSGGIRIFSCGSADHTTVYSGYIHMDGATADNTTLYDGIFYVDDGDTANNTILNGGSLFLYDNGTVNIATVNSAAFYLYGGTANSTTVNSDGIVFVSSGGTANDTTVDSGGYLYVASDGTAMDVMENGGYVDIEDGANVTFVANTFSGLELSYTSATIHSGTISESATVNSGGSLYVFYGGMANDTTVNSGGNMYVSSGGTANNTTVDSGAYFKVNLGGTANSTTVNSGGRLYVSSGGTANSTTIDLGSMYISSGGTADNTTINNGRIFVYSGGTANNTTVNSGGYLQINSGGTATGKLTFDEDGSAWVDSGCFVDFDLTQADPEDFALVNDLSRVNGMPTYTLTITVIQTDGTYRLAGGAAEFDETLTVKSKNDETLGTLMVGETISIDGVDYTLNLDEDNVLSVTVESAAQTKPAKFDVDGNGISDVMFVWTGYNYAHGYWMNGDANDWRSTYAVHPAEWENLGCYDMNGDGKADSVLVGNITLEAGKGAYIGYYLNAEDTDANWVNIDFLNNEAGVTWKNKVCNLTGNANANSIIWYAPDMYTVGAWLDGTSEWALLSGNFGGEFWQMVGCGDFDGDGKASVLMSGGNGQMLYSVGLDGVVTSHGEANWAGWEVRAIGDFAGDGKEDIVLFHSTLGAMAMLVDGNADDYVSLGQLDPADWFVVGAGDYNNDQKDDLLVRQKSTGMLGYYNACDTSETGWVEMGRGVDLNWTVIA